MRILSLLLALLLPSAARAVDPPPCWPEAIGGTSTFYGWGWSANGTFAWEQCPDGRFYYLLGDWTLSLSQLGTRIDTIRSKVDQQAAATASWKRNVTLPASDPRFDAIRADMMRAIAEASR